MLLLTVLSRIILKKKKKSLSIFVSILFLFCYQWVYFSLKYTCSFQTYLFFKRYFLILLCFILAILYECVKPFFAAWKTGFHDARYWWWQVTMKYMISFCSHVCGSSLQLWNEQPNLWVDCTDVVVQLINTAFSATFLHVLIEKTKEC